MASSSSSTQGKRDALALIKTKLERIEKESLSLVSLELALEDFVTTCDVSRALLVLLNDNDCCAAFLVNVGNPPKVLRHLLANIDLLRWKIKDASDTAKQQFEKCWKELSKRHPHYTHGLTYLMLMRNALFGLSKHLFSFLKLGTQKMGPHGVPWAESNDYRVLEYLLCDPKDRVIFEQCRWDVVLATHNAMMLDMTRNAGYRPDSYPAEVKQVERFARHFRLDLEALKGMTDPLSHGAWFESLSECIQDLKQCDGAINLTKVISWRCLDHAFYRPSIKNYEGAPSDEAIFDEEMANFISSRPSQQESLADLQHEVDEWVANPSNSMTFSAEEVSLPSDNLRREWTRRGKPTCDLTWSSHRGWVIGKPLAGKIGLGRPAGPAPDHVPVARRRKPVES